MNGCDHAMKAPETFHSGDAFVHLTTNRTIFMNEIFLMANSHEMIALLFYLDQVDSTTPITIYIHSPGGEVPALIQIYDVMNLIQAPIRTICMSEASSAGSVLLAAGTPGMRYIASNAEVMMHGIQFIFPLPHDSLKESKEKMIFLKKHNGDFLKILAKHTGQKLSTIREDSAIDKYFRAEEAVKYGFADHII